MPESLPDAQSSANGEPEGQAPDPRGAVTATEMILASPSDPPLAEMPTEKARLAVILLPE
jgi:hypothetical protein